MATNQRSGDKSTATTRSDTYDQSRFVAVDEAPRRLDRDDLTACDEPQTRDDDTERFYAVGRINGVISYGPNELQNADGCRVLYMSAEQRVVEYQFAVTAGEFETIPVAVDVAPDAERVATPADRVAERYASVLGVHADREARR